MPNVFNGNEIYAECKGKSQDRKIYLCNLTVEEIRYAESALIKDAQVSLRNKKDFQHLIKQLGLVDRDGILKCKGRLSNSDLEEAAREPIILPKEHWLTELIISACHKRVHHCGLRATLAELRGKYWVPRGRQIVKKVIGNCVVCKGHGVSFMEKLMRLVYRTSVCGGHHHLLKLG